ncbi:MAG: MotA/TolQ/ExbB proton channel family protein [Spirochaetales bacterium]|nr:MotA/TolQ/ExbB proton channel family protein [Spirochaetales bacterium]HNQ97318.1 MotA/TolQ/ExbB proton channel family protein [Treponemataceae bacterium]
MENEWSLIALFKLGGPFMWPLLAFSIATVALAVERVVYLFWHNMKVSDLKDKSLSLIRDGRISEAVSELAKEPRKNTSATILLSVVQNAEQGEARMEKAAEAEAQERIRRCENGFNYLTALSSIAPLTGFLGTVSGMIGAFKSIASATEVNAQLVANGIYEALITTVFGLMIAIVALVSYNLMIQRVDTFAAEITKAVSDLVSAILKKQEQGAKGQ